MPSIDRIAALLTRHRPRRLPDLNLLAHCGVAMILSEREDAPEPSVLLIRRAEREGDPWSGQMGLPGGRMEDEDADTLEAAIRETEEETGLELDPAACIGRLSDLIARPVPMLITPYVFRLDRGFRFRPNQEVDEVVWTPLDFFTPANREYMDWPFLGVNWRMECYFYEDRRIWGLTLMMLNELLELLPVGGGSYSQDSE